MFGVGTPEIILLLSVVLLFFGAKKLPDLARGLGRGVREFRDATQEVKASIDGVKADVSEPFAN